MKTKSDIAMFAVAVGDALASAWGENDPAIDEVIRVLAAHGELVAALKAAREYLNLDNAGPELEAQLSAALAKLEGK